MRPMAGLLWPRVSPGASSPGPAPPPCPIPFRARGARRGSPAPPPQRSMPTNKGPLPPSPPRAPFFEPDANLTLTSIIRSALSKLVVSSPTLSSAPPTQHHSFHPTLLPPPSPSGEQGKGSTLQDRTSQADRSIRPGPRTHARTHTAPHTAHPTPKPAPLTALHTRPRAGRPT